jgi:hypothetical protein
MKTFATTTAPVDLGVGAPSGDRCEQTDHQKGKFMTTITPIPDPTPPAGAEPDIWEDDGHRDVYASVGCVLSSGDILRCPLVTTMARQDQAGALDEIRVDVEADGALTAWQARELARYLIQAAAIAESWAGSTGADCRLATAKAAVMDAYIGLRELPGNAGDYLRAALDSIADAQAVTR